MATPKHSNTVTRLQVENFMRVRSVDIQPGETGLVELHGANAQGKSSVLRAMWSALGGKGESPQKPVREGEQQARARVELGDLVVERTWRPDGTSKLEVFNQAGATYKSPQKMLDALVSRVAFDPIAFMRYEPKRQAQVLAEVAGIDTSEAEERVASLYEERRVQGRLVTSMRASLGDEPEKPEDVAAQPDLAEELEGIDRLREGFRAAIDAKEKNLSQLQAAGDALLRIEEQIRDLERTRDAAREEHARLQDAMQPLEEAVAEAEVALSASRTKEEVLEQMSGAQQAQRAMGVWRGWTERRKELKAEEAKHESLEEALEEARRDLQTLVESGTYPVEGLAVTSDGVLFMGVPLEQASSAEQLRVSMAMAMATQPDLRIVHIKEGSLLDSVNLELVSDMAVAAGFQVWVEVVDDQGLRGLVIEDGEIRGAGVDSTA